jgi:23S rRNA (cytidine1920-2'-O)/16S rRNA (cytidine1409-2'-O)-methyltransferase
VVDVSFISLTLVLASIFSCVESDGAVIALIKPQFELEPSEIGRGGIVRDEQLRQKAVSRICRYVTQQLRRQSMGIMDSPITGAKGNREFLACLR